MNPNLFPEMKRAVGYGAGAAAMRTGSIILSKQVPTMAKINPAFGIVGTFMVQALTVGAITSGAICTFYTTRAVTKGHERKEK